MCDCDVVLKGFLGINSSNSFYFDLVRSEWILTYWIGPAIVNNQPKRNHKPLPFIFWACVCVMCLGYCDFATLPPTYDEVCCATHIFFFYNSP